MIPLISNFTAPTEAITQYPECGFNYCVPHTLCVNAIESATRLHYFVEIGFIVVALLLICWCEFYRRKSKKLEKENDELKKRVGG